MTVALGLCFSGSVLVGADSQMTAGDSKLDGNKTGEFTASWGQVIVSFAGNAKYAAAGFQRCLRAKESPPVLADPIEALMRILRDHYHAHVFTRPEYDKHPEYDYMLFLGIRINGRKPQLFEVEYGDYREISSYQCAGTGGEYARIVLRWLHSEHITVDRAIALAAYVIGHVKVRAQYCGGQTRLKVITEAGIIDTSEVEKRGTVLTEHIENVGNWFSSRKGPYKVKKVRSNLDANNPNAVTCFTADPAFLKSRPPSQPSMQRDQSTRLKSHGKKGKRS